MGRNLKTVLYLVLSFWLLSHGQILAGNYKTTELNHQISEISLVRKDITRKISQATDMRGQLHEQMQELIEEIIREKNRYQLESFQDANKNLRISYDLKLVHQLRGYVASLDQKISYFRNADETLGYYHQQVQDDMKIIRALNDFEVDKLISQINAALDEYIPETKKQMIDVQVVQWIDSEQLWNEIVNQ